MNLPFWKVCTTHGPHAASLGAHTKLQLPILGEPDVTKACVLRNKNLTKKNEEPKVCLICLYVSAIMWLGPH